MATNERPLMVVITGSRHDSPELWWCVRRILESYVGHKGRIVVLHGNCKTGADSFTEEIAEDLG